MKEFLEPELQIEKIEVLDVITNSWDSGLESGEDDLGWIQ